MHPVGPLPASTYWRRRAVLLVVLIVLLLLVKSCAGGGDSPKKKASGTRPTATPTVSQSASPSPSPTASRPPVTVGGACPDSALQLRVTTDAATYAVGSEPSFTLVVTNTSTVSCTRDLGSKVVSLR